MTDDKLDPMKLFRDWISEWERITNDVGERVTGTSEFTQMMHQVGNTQMQMKKMMREGMTKALANANMPSREDVDALNDRLRSIELQLARIESLITGARMPGQEAAPSPKRTKKPPVSSGFATSTRSPYSRWSTSLDSCRASPRSAAGSSATERKCSSHGPPAPFPRSP